MFADSSHAFLHCVMPVAWSCSHCVHALHIGGQQESTPHSCKTAERRSCNKVLLLLQAHMEGDTQNEDASPMDEDNSPDSASPISMPEPVDANEMPNSVQVAAQPSVHKVSLRPGQKRKQQDSCINQPRLNHSRTCCEMWHSVLP